MRRIITNVTVLALSILLLVSICAAQQTQATEAPTFSVIHHFSGPDGAEPYAGLTINLAGNLYGTTITGGAIGAGTVFKLTQSGSGWTLNTLYNFAGGNDGASPTAKVIFGPYGTLYGTTSRGGSGDNGTVFSLRPQPRVCQTALCPWTETVLYRFVGGREDGSEPSYGDLVFDQAGASLYGTTIFGGSGNCGDSTCGTVYKLTPSGGGWIECLVYSFTGLGRDGANPYGGVVFDDAGHLYGTTGIAFEYDGIVFQLTPSGCRATETTLYGFDDGPNDGGFPLAGLLSDASGNFYGTASDGGPGLGGTVFELVKNLHGGWDFKLLYGFTRYGQSQFQGPFGALIMDANGNLYGTTNKGGAHGLGSIFKLLPNADGTWAHQDLHDFDGSDGCYPVGNVTLDASGNISGTASQCGQYGLGVVWKITQ